MKITIDDVSPEYNYITYDVESTKTGWYLSENKNHLVYIGSIEDNLDDKCFNTVHFNLNCEFMIVEKRSIGQITSCRYRYLNKAPSIHFTINNE